MTTIVAVENDHKVLIGSDSQVTAGYQKGSLPYGKIFTNGPYTIAAAGRLRFLQALEHMELPEPGSLSLDRFMSTVFGPTVHAAANKIAAGAAEESVAVVVIHRQVYVLHGDGSVIRNNRGHYSIGSGSEYALGSLSHIEGDATKDDILRALRAAAQYDIATSGPFWVREI